MRKELKKKKKIKLRNKKLIKKYPWLRIRNVWTDKFIEIGDYSSTELDALPEGWVRCFGVMMVKELNALLERAHYVNKFRIVEAKEKYGQLRLYHNGVPRSIYDEFERVIDKYTYLSENVCANCGRPDVFMTFSGWDFPLCKHCWDTCINDTREYEQVISDKDTGRMADSFTIRRFSKDGNVDTTYDISQTAEKIRKRYEKRSNRRLRRMGRR